MRIYNSLTKKKEEFAPLKKGRVSMYVCGVTVYDDCHIGHARGAYVFGVIRNLLKFFKFGVRYVRNITDIDDKIIERAKQAGKTTEEIARYYTRRYYQDMDSLGIKKADIEPRATEEINQMINYISRLIKKNFAYQAGGDVYFRVRQLDSYGGLSGQTIDELRVGARIRPGENKQDPLDFALWKQSKEGEPSWPSPWGEGRPGWHIECSVMSTRYLGESFDIHGGGRDLIFPHHENELAQSRAAGSDFAHFWIHNGLLSVNGEKMSKSLGNFITIPDFLKGHHPEELKIFFLGAHYSKPIDYTEERIEEAGRARERFYILFDKIERLKGTSHESRVTNQAFKDELSKLRKGFIAAMGDDFNMPQALGVLFEMVNLANRYLDEDKLSPADARLVRKTLIELGGIFGLFQDTNGAALSGGGDKNEIEDLIKQRSQLRREHKFAEADRIRDQLEEKGITIEDTKEGTIWRRG